MSASGAQPDTLWAHEKYEFPLLLPLSFYRTLIVGRALLNSDYLIRSQNTLEST